MGSIVALLVSFFKLGIVNWGYQFLGSFAKMIVGSITNTVMGLAL